MGGLEVIEPNPDHRAASAAWLAVVLERLDNGQLPFTGVDDPEADYWSQCQREQERIAGHSLVPASYHDFFWDEQPASPLVDSLLRRLQAAVMGQPWEETFWDQVLTSVYTAIPDDIASDLLERGVSVMLLGHQPLSDRVLFRLVDEVDEALLTLAKRRYIHEALTPMRSRRCSTPLPNTSGCSARSSCSSHRTPRRPNGW